MDRDVAEAVVAMALARGALSAEDVRCAKARVGASGTVTAVEVLRDLVRERVLGEEVVRALEAELSGGEGRFAGRTATVVEHQATNHESEGQAAGGSTLSGLTERFEVLEQLGEGGMGTVMRAFDRVLQRHVALKLIRDPSPAQRRRFLREARAQARVNHDHVCKVFDVGERDGRLYVAMQLIVGPTLRQAAGSLTRDERVDVVRQAAEGVHAAHRMGLVHRDLKPGNIMLERIDKGVWKAYVVDFGLVRELDDASFTATEGFVGTPHYMAPEQIRGESDRVDWRTDVYALGVTLYELLAGAAPFASSSPAQVLVQVLHEEPPPLIRVSPRIPGDLEAIVMKCLEKEPHRRYGSARELADDLGRFLAGEPVVARRATPLDRLVRRVRRNRVIASVVGAALVVVVVLAALLLRTALESRERARAARRFGQEVSAIESMAKISALLPLHDTRQERSAIRERLGAIRAEMATLGGIAEGPGNYALGRGFLVLGEPEKARQHLEAAWRAGYRDAAAAYALGESLAALYQKGLAASSKVTNQPLREIQRRELERTLRDPALSYLRAGRGASGEVEAYVEGLLAFHEGRWDDALRHARAATAQVPWHVEAHKLAGDALLRRAESKKGRGKADVALEDYERAGKAYHTAAETARSDVSVREAECVRRLRVFEGGWRRREPTESALAWVITACDEALQADPESWRSYESKSMAYSAAGEDVLRGGRDPGEYDEEGVRMARVALRLNPADEDAHLAVGFCLYNDTRFALQIGGDPRPSAQGAIDAYERAADLSPNFALPYSNLAAASWLVADWENRTGGDPRPWIERGTKAAAKTIELRPAHAGGHHGLALQYWVRGQYEARRGGDPRWSFSLATANFTAALACNRELTYAHNNFGLLLVDWAEFEASQGGNAETILAAALGCFANALRLNPDSDVTLQGLGEVMVRRARRSFERGAESSAELREARNSLRRALEINPDEATTYVCQAQADIVEARALARSGRDPAGALAAAGRSLARAERLRARDPLTHAAWAELAWRKAEIEVARGRSPEGAVEAGFRRVELGSRFGGENGEMLRLRGELALVAARAQEDTARKQRAIEAILAFNEALCVNQNLTRAIEPSLAEARRLAHQ